MGQRVGHDIATEQQQQSHYYFVCSYSEKASKTKERGGWTEAEEFRGNPCLPAPTLKGRAKAKKKGQSFTLPTRVRRSSLALGPGCRQKGPTYTLSRSSNSNELPSPCLLPPSNPQSWPRSLRRGPVGSGPAFLCLPSSQGAHLNLLWACSHQATQV